MDSGKSDSLQSSSGGEEEYDSRTESISNFLNPSIGFGQISHHPQAPPPPQAAFFEVHNLGAFTPNLDLVWSRSEPNYADLGNLTGLSSFPTSTQSLLGASQGPFPSSSSMPLPSIDGNRGMALSSSDQTNAMKNSRKRTRASRRAPTTVLTTDTSNFRQMVQEFTGIPAPPFSGSPYSRRLDLFGPGSALRSGNLDAFGPLHPFRPSAQKAQTSSFLSSSSSTPSLLNSTLIEAIASTTTTNETRSTIASLPPFSTGYPMGLDPIRTFQSLLQSPLKYSLPNAPVFGSKSEGNSGIPSLDGLGVCHQRVNVNLIAANDGRGPANLGSFDGNPPNVSTYKLNCSASTSEQNVSSRNEGTVDSWICPSD
ncbi:VQ motif-containing protein [Actinidia chinensis var. chinensis]|uniref:VQ motif-containing protein n=1 Tax=Actinidia chinensis var. chinensis TaxID=1590841 RepID=A0A2R6Q0T0_ACTCC|nr:VQ motif-containing protein [Actinidia chinensis var. chinensis]